MEIRYPRPLAPGDTIAVTAPSSGVPDVLRPRLDFCVTWLRTRGYEVVLGECLDGSGVTSAPAADRAAELTAMLTDPGIAAVLPPWGGELAVEILPHLDLEAIARAEPTWLIGYSDISTLLVPLTLATGVATIHGHNLMDTPYRLPSQVLPWHEVAALPVAGRFTQRRPPRVRSAQAGFDRWQDGPELAAITEYTLDEPATPWSLLNGEDRLDVSGRLIGGCIETVAPLAGSPFGDLTSLRAQQDGLIVYLEASSNPSFDIARRLWGLRLAGWFDDARAVLIGRTHAPAESGVTQREAVAGALGDLGVPVVVDVDCGHVVPALALVNGARARVTVAGSRAVIEQSLV